MFLILKLFIVLLKNLFLEVFAGSTDFVELWDFVLLLFLFPSFSSWISFNNTKSTDKALLILLSRLDFSFKNTLRICYSLLILLYQDNLIFHN